jgi:hypothetical protein
MTNAELRHASAQLDLARRRRELLFWTIITSVAVIVLVATTVAFVVSLIQGSSMVTAHLAVGALGGACARSSRGLANHQP